MLYFNINLCYLLVLGKVYNSETPFNKLYIYMIRVTGDDVDSRSNIDNVFYF